MSTDEDDKIPIVETYRGVELHDEQDEERLRVVRAEIDHVFDEIEDLSDLVKWACYPGHAPESRLLAAAIVRAEFKRATDERRVRPDVNLERLGAGVAALDSNRRRCAWYYCSIFEPHDPPGEPRKVPRKVPLRGEPTLDELRRRSPLWDEATQSYRRE